MNLVFDLETDGLLEDFTKIHCLCIHDLDEKSTYTFNDEGKGEPIVRGIEMLADASCIIGHNLLAFDVPVIKRIYPWFVPPYMVDTLLLSRLYHPDRLYIDLKRKIRGMPQSLYGRHSLESYGWRLGSHKSEFAKETDWKNWSPEMEAYMEQDVNLTTQLWHYFQPFLNGSN